MILSLRLPADKIEAEFGHDGGGRVGVRPGGWSTSVEPQEPLGTAGGASAARRCGSVAELVDAIRCLAIRGAPALGIAGAMGLALAAELAPDELAPARVAVREASARLGASRPTAVNLGWALAQAEPVLAAAGSAAAVRDGLRALAERIHRDEVERCEAMGAHGAELLPVGARILTHCNAGRSPPAATAPRWAWCGRRSRPTRPIHVWVDETRPLLQGARLAAWEFAGDGIAHTVIADVAAGQLFSPVGWSTQSCSAPTASPPTATWPTRW